MKIVKSTDPQAKPSVVMMVYGHGGVGKTTFASTAPKALLVDCENGAKYFGLRGIKVDVARVAQWQDLEGIFEIAKSGTYDTIIIDPIGELMEKLKQYMVAKGDRKLVQADGSPSMAGWGWLKDTMRKTIKVLRDSGVHLILVAHVAEDKDEEKLVKRPMIMTKLSDELVNMVDIVGYMTVVSSAEEGEKRIILVDPSQGDKYVAKDRTGQLGKIIPPNFNEIVDAVQGNKQFAWAKENGKSSNEEATDEKKPASKSSSVQKKLNKAGKKVATPEDSEVNSVE